MPTRLGETLHSAACWRTYVTAANPSAAARAPPFPHLLKLLMVGIRRDEFLRGIVTGVRQSVLQHKRGYALGNKVSGHIDSFAVDRGP